MLLDVVLPLHTNTYNSTEADLDVHMRGAKVVQEIAHNCVCIMEEEQDVLMKVDAVKVLLADHSVLDTEAEKDVCLMGVISPRSDNSLIAAAI